MDYEVPDMPMPEVEEYEAGRNAGYLQGLAEAKKCIAKLKEELNEAETRRLADHLKTNSHIANLEEQLVGAEKENAHLQFIILEGGK